MRGGVPKVSYATPGERCRCDSDLTTPWQRTSLDRRAPRPTGFTWPLKHLCTKPMSVRARCYKTALEPARPTRHQSRISSSSSNDGKNLGVTCLYAR